ncbi:hypothetical protein P170DRAFT_230268 [Aspergillus steynii IBT 23096]|uniref:Uncharacterized protein n=1 Tax=Aspergillus steynii IBT 23096 TaxID=1392250 RepID=A0A2I2G278_9EURO|nr:uncharacterized protein P170DRAFT_230268 [Aspergillus steynii IBT 23096]PLB46992.1 hypothetical protein P170DRAFT_230268 [Aspergillus steynii IBT 23096]
MTNTQSLATLVIDWLPSDSTGNLSILYAPCFMCLFFFFFLPHCIRCKLMDLLLPVIIAMICTDACAGLFPHSS